MKEINDILKACSEAKNRGKRTALATVVHVEGSSYRRPGARMLVTDDGGLTGAISGGCLEGDALRKALLAIAQGRNKLVTYDTTDEDDAKFGVQLGCNGIVHILFEPLTETELPNPVSLLRELISKREDAVLVTLFSLRGPHQPGTGLLYRKGAVHTSLPDGLKEAVLRDAEGALLSGASALNAYQQGDHLLQGFVEMIPPPVSVVVAGAGNDVQPLVEMTSLLGWQTTVADGRRTHATAARFPKAAKVLVAKGDELLQQVETDARTVFLLMTHNYNYDLAVLKTVLETACAYIGILGPKKKTDRMLADLREEGIVLNTEQLSRIHSPVGLDIGAETAEEIAVSIVSEIKAVMAGREGLMLRNKTAAIHNRPEQTASS